MGVLKGLRRTLSFSKRPDIANDETSHVDASDDVGVFTVRSRHSVAVVEGSAAAATPAPASPTRKHAVAPTGSRSAWNFNGMRSGDVEPASPPMARQPSSGRMVVTPAPPPAGLPPHPTTSTKKSIHQSSPGASAWGSTHPEKEKDAKPSMLSALFHRLDSKSGRSAGSVTTTSVKPLESLDGEGSKNRWFPQEDRPSAEDRRGTAASRSAGGAAGQGSAKASEASAIPMGVDSTFQAASERIGVQRSNSLMAAARGGNAWT